MSSPTPELSRPGRPFTTPTVRREADIERVHRAMEQWRRRSRLIHFLRKALPVCIGLVTLSLVGWVGVQSLMANLPNLKSRGASVRMTNPRFYGQDDKGRSFVMGGREARRDSRGQGRVIIEAPVLRLSTGPNKTMDVSSRTGVYDQGTKLADLRQQVHLVDTGSGFVFDTEQALVDSQAGTVVGNSPVKGHGPLGETSASSYSIQDHGAKVLFDGNVHSHIVQSGGKP